MQAVNRSTPAQNEVNMKMMLLESDLNNAILKRDAGLGDENINQLIKSLQKKVKTAKKESESKKRNAEYQRKFRSKRQALMEDVMRKNPEIQQQLKIRGMPGRPRVEDDQPELLQVLTEIASFGGGADDRRRSEMIRSCKTLDDLVKELQSAGFTISRTATYFRLLPKNSRTIEGKRHINTVPVKLTRATTDLHKQHPDTKFCTASIRALEAIASLLGPAQVFFLSQVISCRIPNT